MATEGVPPTDEERKAARRERNRVGAAVRRAANPGAGAAYMRARRAAMSPEEKEAWRVKNNAARRAKYAANPEPAKSVARAFYKANAETLNAKRRGKKRTDPSGTPEYHHAWYMAHREEAIRRSTLQAQQNRVHRREWSKRYFRTLSKTSVTYRLSRTLYSRINSALQGKRKPGSAIRDLGCTVGELRIHLERQFLPGMSWDNHGLHGWHVDHIRPLQSFDLTDRDQFLAACHFTNLRPMWWRDNIKKGPRIVVLL